MSPTEKLAEIIGHEKIDSSRRSAKRMLRDNSWLSPTLQAQRAERQEKLGTALGIEAVVSPTTEEDVLAICQVAVESGIPLTPRGAATSNFGLFTPEQGGWIVDVRKMRGTLDFDGDQIQASAGVSPQEIEKHALQHGRELPLLTTTHATSTISGWVSGGHVGLGSSKHGSVWDDIVRKASIATAEPSPQRRALKGHATDPLLHTFGAFGLISQVTLRTEPAHQWVEAISYFSTFDAASEFVSTVTADPNLNHRVVTAQERPLMVAFDAFDQLDRQGCGVLMILDRDSVSPAQRLASKRGGTFDIWQQWSVDGEGMTRPSIAEMVYGHRMLSIKKAFPDAGFLHVYFDPGNWQDDVAQLKHRFDGEVLLETKYIYSTSMLARLGYRTQKSQPLPAAVATLPNGNDLTIIRQVMDFCTEVGIKFQNPNAGCIEDNGLFPDMGSLLSFKRQVDPHNLFNPGKVRSFDEERVSE